MKNSNRFVLGLVFAVIGIALFARFIAMNVVRDQASLEGAPIPAVVTGSIGATVAAALPALEVPPKPVVVAGNAATIAAAR